MAAAMMHGVRAPKPPPPVEEESESEDDYHEYSYPTLENVCWNGLTDESGMDPVVEKPELDPDKPLTAGQRAAQGPAAAAAARAAACAAAAAEVVDKSSMRSARRPPNVDPDASPAPKKPPHNKSPHFKTPAS